MRIVVVGGGVAGSTAAVALRRTGASVTVFEAHEDPAGAVGSFVSLAVNGQRGLAAIGCLERVRARGFPVERRRIWSGTGKLLGDAARGRPPDDPLRSITLMRADLVRELRAAAVDAGAAVVTGERVVGVSDGGVALAGGRVVEADLVVGADGIWSTLRGVLDPAAPAPVYAGLYSVSGRTRGVDLGRHTEAGAFNLTFARRATFLHLRDPAGELWWSAQVKSPVEPVRDGVGQDEWLRRLGELFAHDAVPAAILAAATGVQGSSLTHRLGPVPTWHDDRIVLIGDAAHPVGAGQGASMAIEDALALAAAVHTAPASVGAALAAYQGMRGDRITRMRKASDENKDTKVAGALRSRVQDVLIPLFFRMFYERATSWLYDYTPPQLPDNPSPNGLRPGQEHAFG